MTAQTISLLALITVSEATIGVFVKLTGGLIPIQTLNSYALSLAALLLFGFMPSITGKPLLFPRNNLKDTLLVGILIAAQISVFNYAMTLVPIANAVIFWSIAPFFTFIFSAVFLGEKARPGYMLIFVIALVGIAIANPLKGSELVGNLVALGDGAVYAAMVTYLRYEGKSETGSDIAWSMLVAAIVLSPSTLLFGAGDILRGIHYETLGVTVPVLLWVLGLGVVSTGFAYLGISMVLKTLDANVYALIDIIVSPLVASFFGYLVFGDVPSWRMVLGGAMLLGAGFWLTRETSRGMENRAVHPCQCA
ncbi:DMT family transporter [Parvibaculum sp.]|uniref:DMT family transporter n=3 Tax=Hyphomicrobiales TaxID=356 RepID=UPI000C95C297|nr:DMT family transporter [Parvibaculum sp.]MAB12935.1 EamA family transporter [Parvibaculum sp.]